MGFTFQKHIFYASKERPLNDEAQCGDNGSDRYKLANQKGQSLVEFVLLMSIVMLVSIGFMKVVNSNVETYWRAMGQMLVEDDNQRLELR